MELTSKVEKMELEARKTADRLAEVGVQKDALERDVATMKTESDRLRCVHPTSVALVQLEEMQGYADMQLQTVRATFLSLTY